LSRSNPESQKRTVPALYQAPGLFDLTEKKAGHFFNAMPFSCTFLLIPCEAPLWG